VVFGPAIVASGHALRGIDPGAAKIVQVKRQQVVCSGTSLWFIVG
jgi:hypothetical protein